MDNQDGVLMVCSIVLLCSFKGFTNAHKGSVPPQLSADNIRLFGFGNCFAQCVKNGNGFGWWYQYFFVQMLQYVCYVRCISMFFASIHRLQS